MENNAIERDWELVLELLPKDLETTAKQHGAFRRVRGVKDATTLLRLLFLHVVSGLSLRSTVARAAASGIAEISDVAMLKRLRSSGEWLVELCKQLLKKVIPLKLEVPIFAGRRVRAYDATCISKRGSQETDWRIHYSMQIPNLQCDFFVVTDASGGETYKRVDVKRGDVLLADRGLAHREGVAYVVDQEGDVIVRLNRTNFPLEDSHGDAIDVLSKLRTLKGNEVGEWAVQFESASKMYRARLCAVRKTFQAPEDAKKKARKYARKKGHKVKPETLESLEYIFVLTTLPAHEASCAQILQCYRARWQVELAFKRLKSLLHIGVLEKRDPESARAWIHAKMLAARRHYQPVRVR
jgi:hypothetical protein